MFAIFQEFFIVYLRLVLFRVKWGNNMKFLCCQENTDFIAEWIEMTCVYNTRAFRIELLDNTVQLVKVLHIFSEHLVLDLVEDLVKIVFPVHFG